LTDKQKELLIELVITAVTIAYYVWVLTPQWKIEYYRKVVTTAIKSRFGRDLPTEDLSPEHRVAIREFRLAMSKWEHENAGKRFD
jgi:hypothetical protein